MDCIAEIFHLIYRFCNQVGQCIIERNTMAFGVFVKLRDINYIWEIIMQGLFYASAVIYPLAIVMEKSEFAAKILLLNPIAQAIQDIRFTLVTQETPTLVTLTQGWKWMAVPLGIVLVTFIVGALYFKKKSPTFAEEI